MNQQEKETLPINDEEAWAKKRGNIRDRYSALPIDEKQEIHAKNREYQRRRRAHLKAKAVASKLDASSESTPIHDLNLEIVEVDTRIDDKGNSCKRNNKGNSCKRKRDMASQAVI